MSDYLHIHFCLQWYKQIRLDLMLRIGDEPPKGLAGVVHVCVRLPDTERVSRRFISTQQMEVYRISASFSSHMFKTLLQDVYCFVGSHSTVNPKHLRLLVSDIPQPRQLGKSGTLADANILGSLLLRI